MKMLVKIIIDECKKFLSENYYDEDSYYSLESEIKISLFNDFLYQNTPDFTKNVPWTVIKFPRLKKIWEDYMSSGVVRDERGLEDITDIMVDNTIKVMIFTNLAGHTESDDEESFEDNIGYWVDEQLNCILPEKKEDRTQLEIPFNDPNQGYAIKPEQHIEPCNTQINQFAENFVNENYDDEKNLNENRSDIREKLYEEMKDKFFYYYMNDPEHKMGGFISDFGLRPLEILLSQLLKENKSENRVVIIDKMLNVIHQRSDIASWFVEGGSKSLSELSGEISEPYRMSDYR